MDSGSVQHAAELQHLTTQSPTPQPEDARNRAQEPNGPLDDVAGPENQAEIGFPPKTADEFFQRGLKSAQLGFPDRAATDFEEAGWLEPDNPEVQFNLGTAYLSMGDFEQATNNFTRAIELNPGVSDVHGNRAVAHAAIGEDEKSEKDVAEAIRLGAPPDGLAAIIEFVKTQRK